MSEVHAFNRVLLALASILLVTLVLGALSGGLTPPAQSAGAQESSAVTIRVTPPTEVTDLRCTATIQGLEGTYELSSMLITWGPYTWVENGFPIPSGYTEVEEIESDGNITLSFYHVAAVVFEDIAIALGCDSTYPHGYAWVSVLSEFPTISENNMTNPVGWPRALMSFHMDFSYTWKQHNHLVVSMISRMSLNPEPTHWWTWRTEAQYENRRYLGYPEYLEINISY